MSRPQPIAKAQAETVAEFLRAVGSGDSRTMAELLHPNATIVIHGTTPFSGLWAGARFFMTSRDRWPWDTVPDTYEDILNMSDGGIFVRWMEAILPADGGEAVGVVEACARIYFESGVVVRMEKIFADTHGVAKALATHKEA